MIEKRNGGAEMKDEWNAWIREDIRLDASGEGLLNGLTFAVKDVFSIAGHISGAGNPDWLRTHAPSKRTAEAIELLLSVGASMHGLTHTDELMYSLNGQNMHYGTPVNPKAVDRLPGGSSSGSAVAVSAGLTDFALGTDTGGSVRVPSSYCGIYGFRPTHGAVSLGGVIPLAPSFDTAGWMAKDAQTLRRVGEVLLKTEFLQSFSPSVAAPTHLDSAGTAQEKSAFTDDVSAEVDTALESHLEPVPFNLFMLPVDAWHLAEPESGKRLKALLPLLTGNAKLEPVRAAEEGLVEWMRVFRLMQGLEIWETHGKWIEEERPEFEANIAERFTWTSTLTRTDSYSEYFLWQSIRARLRSWLGEDRVLVLPTTPGPPPLRLIQGEANEAGRSRTMQLSCIAGLAGLPQLHIPVETGGAPCGLSIIAGAGQDLKLLKWAESWTKLYASALGKTALSAQLQA